MKWHAAETEAAIASTATRRRSSPLDGKREAEGSFKKGKRWEEVLSRGLFLLDRFFATEASMDVDRVRGLVGSKLSGLDGDSGAKFVGESKQSTQKEEEMTRRHKGTIAYLPSKCPSVTWALLWAASKTLRTPLISLNDIVTLYVPPNTPLWERVDPFVCLQF